MPNLTYILLPLLMLLASCVGADTEPVAAPEVTLALSISDAASRSTAGDADRIETLRVIIAHPDGRVEANRLIRTDGGAVDAADLTFEVKRNELKTVLLIANEGAVDYDFAALDALNPAALDAPALYPDDVVNLRLTAVGSERPVPMTAVYLLSTSIEYSRPLQGGSHLIEYRLNLMRTLVRFTLNIYNNRSQPLQISSVGINDAAAADTYLFAHVTGTDSRERVHYITALGAYTRESGTGLAPVLDGTDRSPYTRHFRQHFKASATGAGSYGFTDGAVTLPPSTAPVQIERSHFESNLPATAVADMPYVLSVDFDDNLYSEPLTNLPSLPRNTHVVVNITFTNNDKDLLIEVEPYYGVDLAPGFN